MFSKDLGEDSIGDSVWIAASGPWHVEGLCAGLLLLPRSGTAHSACSAAGRCLLLPPS